MSAPFAVATIVAINKAGTLNGCPVNTLIFQKSTIDAKHSHAPPHPNWTSGQVDIVLGFSLLFFFFCSEL
jgi:hypothetical protein